MSQESERYELTRRLQQILSRQSLQLQIVSCQSPNQQLLNRDHEEKKHENLLNIKNQENENLKQEINKLKKELEEKQVMINCLIENNSFQFKKINELENMIKEYEKREYGSPMNIVNSPN